MLDIVRITVNGTLLAVTQCCAVSEDRLTVCVSGVICIIFLQLCENLPFSQNTNCN